MLVGSSSSSTLAAEVTSEAIASRVRSPPESVPVRWSTASPEKRNAPRMRRSSVSVLSGANVLLLDEPTNNLDPASRAEILAALRSYTGAIVLVTHDEEAVEALSPERVILLPDGVEDAWNEDFEDLVSLA